MHYQRLNNNASGITTKKYLGSVEKIIQSDGSRQVKRYIGGIGIITIDQTSAGLIQSNTFQQPSASNNQSEA